MSFINRRNWAIAVLFTLVAILCPMLSGGCPEICVCKWKGGKRKVECAAKDLVTLISGIDSETQVLDYSENQLRSLPNEMFQKRQLIHLQKLYLSRCQINRISDQAFRGLSNLIELDLSNNHLQALPTTTFADYPLLMRLILSGNQIRQIRSNSFMPLQFLLTLDLSNCQIETIEKDSFKGLNKLEWLKLHGNHLKNIKNPDTSLPRVNSGLSIQQNPWKCDCHLRELLQWLLNSKTPLLSEPVCEEPKRFRGSVIKQVEYDDLACKPYIIPSSSYVEIEQGKNISFVCQVTAIPEASISWLFEGIPVNNNTSVIHPFYKYYVEQGTTEKVSELFVFNVRIQNNGTYKCVAKNKAGTFSSNFTIKVIYEEEQFIPEPETVSYIHILLSSIITLIIILILTLIISCLWYYKKKNSSSDDCKTTDLKMKSKTKSNDRQYQVDVVVTKNNEQESKIISSKKSLDINNPDLISNTKGSPTVGVGVGVGVGVDVENYEHYMLLTTNMEGTSYGTIISAQDIYQCDQLGCEYSTNDDENITVRVNPMENHIIADTAIPIRYQCGCLFPIVNDDDIGTFYNTLEFVTDNTSSSKENDFLQPPNAFDKTVLHNSNLRCNLEGYPYPQQQIQPPEGTTSLQPLHLNIRQEECTTNTTTPILSPPDPFKSENTNNMETLEII